MWAGWHYGSDTSLPATLSGFLLLKGAGWWDLFIYIYIFGSGSQNAGSGKAAAWFSNL